MESSDNRLIFYDTPASLQRMSAFRVALDLWTHKVQNGDSTVDHRQKYADRIQRSRELSIESTDNEGIRIITKHRILCDSDNQVWIPDTKMQEEIKALNVPAQIMELIADFVVKIIEEIIDWLEIHFKRAPFSKKNRENLKKKSKIDSAFKIMTNERLSLMVWRQDATIDYEKSARQLVKNGELDVFHRFDLICEYFMEDELRNNSDDWFRMQTKNSRIFIEDCISNRARVGYWNTIITGEVPNSSILEGRGYVMCYAMNTTSDSRNFASTRIAFDHVDADKRIQFMTYLVLNGGSTRYGNAIQRSRHAKLIKLLISKCTEKEQYTLFTKPRFPIELVKKLAFSEDGADVENAVKTWLHVRNLVNGDAFISMLRDIGDMRISPDDYMHELLVKLWHCSPPHLKEFVYQLPENNTFLYQFCIRPKYVYEEENRFYNAKRYDGFKQRDDGILIEILTDAEPEFRKDLWRNYWTNLIDRSRPASLKTIIELCLLRNEMKKFESSIPSSHVFRRYFCTLIVNGKCSDLNKFLKLFACGEKQQVVELRRRILEGASDQTLIFKNSNPNDGSVEALGEFLTEAFGELTDSLVKFKSNIISSCVTPLNLDNCNEMMKIFRAAEILCDEQELTKVKEKILQTCKSIASSMLASNQPVMQSVYTMPIPVMQPLYPVPIPVTQSLYPLPMSVSALNRTSREPLFPMPLLWCLGSAKKVDEFHRSLYKRKWM